MRATLEEKTRGLTEGNGLDGESLGYIIYLNNLISRNTPPLPR